MSLFQSRFLREAKPGCFQTGGFPLFPGKVLLVGALIGQKRQKGQIGKIPKSGEPGNITKVQKVAAKKKKTYRDGRVQIGKLPVVPAIQDRNQHPNLYPLAEDDCRLTYSKRSVHIRVGLEPADVYKFARILLKFR